MTPNSPYWPISKRSARICWLPMWTASPCGDIGTVDVVYPSFSLFPPLNPLLFEAQVRPVLEYAGLLAGGFPSPRMILGAIH